MLRSITLTSATTRSTTRPTVGFGGADPYTPADEFSGGANGWLCSGLDGGLEFLVESGGSVAVDMDPIGYMADLSGNGNHLIQATSGIKPVCRISNGIASAYFTTNKRIGCSFVTQVPRNRTEVAVIRVAANTPAGEAYPHSLFETSGGFFDTYFIRDTETDKIVFYGGPPFLEGEINCPSYGNTFILVLRRGAGAIDTQTECFTYTSGGALVASDLHFTTQAVYPVESMLLGINYPMIPFHIPFSMGIEGFPDTANLISYLAGKLASWSPT